MEMHNEIHGAKHICKETCKCKDNIFMKVQYSVTFVTT